jgi:two-component system, cell cycle response regulator
MVDDDARGHRHQRLEEVISLYQEVTSTLDSAAVLETVVQRVASCIAASRASVLLVEGDQARVLATCGTSGARDAVIDLERYPEISACLASGRTLVIDDLGADPLLERVRHLIQNLQGVSTVIVPLVGDGVIGTICVHVCRAGRPFAADEVSFCEMVVSASLNALRNSRLFHSLEDEKRRFELLAITDRLTGVYNQAYLYLRLKEEFARAMRYGIDLSLLMLDLDDFKRVNDSHGHLAGDAVLRQLAGELRRAIRRTDVLARYGGEEFAILLPSTDLGGAMREAERLRRMVERARFDGLGEVVTVRLSIGVASSSTAGAVGPLDFLAQADSALYSAKESGKNCVRQYGDRSIEVPSGISRVLAD